MYMGARCSIAHTSATNEGSISSVLSSQVDCPRTDALEKCLTHDADTAVPDMIYIYGESNVAAAGCGHRMRREYRRPAPGRVTNLYSIS